LGLLHLGKVRGAIFFLSSLMQRLNKLEVSGKKTILKDLFCNSHYQSHNTSSSLMLSGDEEPEMKPNLTLMSSLVVTSPEGKKGIRFYKKKNFFVRD